ncbi:acyltransferase domain-containing protein, partial [Streptomyces sparsus]
MSSFGISGTNAHVILEAPTGPETEPDLPTADPETTDAGDVPWIVTARTADALAGQAARLLDHVREHLGVPLADTALSLATTRTPLPHRAVLIGAERAALLSQLEALADGTVRPPTVTGTARTSGRTALLFSGQGAQRPGMGRELYDAHPVFAETFDEVCARLPDLRDTVFVSPGTEAEADRAAEILNRTANAQPALFAFEIALFRLLESLGLRPDLLAGHSVGEIAAAHVAGVLSLDDACTLVAARGRLMQALPAGGAMASLPAGEDEVLPLLAGRDETVGIAALNGPAATVVSGTEEAVAEICAHFSALGRRPTRLHVSHAFHSPLMDPVLEEFRAVAASLTYREPLLTIVSGLTGTAAAPGELTDPEYWVRHVREPVRFHDCVRALRHLGARRFLEVGPDGPLTALAGAALGDPEDTGADAVFVPAVRRGH